MEIALTRGYIAIVDPEDGELLSQFKWYTVIGRNTMYAGRGHSTTKMHNQIMDPPQGYLVDHINRNGLDNRRSNLRLVTASQNMLNRRKFSNTTSMFRGVSRRSGTTPKRWQASIKIDGKASYLGSYVTQEEAALAYDAAARQLHGEFAQLNFPDLHRTPA